MNTRAAITSEAQTHGLACFELHGDLFGVPIRLVREINPHVEITAVRTDASYVRGLVNLRSQVVTVIDIAERLGLGPCVVDGESRLVVFKARAELPDDVVEELETSEDSVAFLVDRIADVVNPKPGDLEAPPANLRGSGRGLMAAICRTPTGTIGVLDARVLLRPDLAALGE